MDFLVVEDENTKYNDICDVINCMNLTTIERANNAKEAIRLLRNKFYDIILLDMTLLYSKDNRKLNTYAGKELLFDMQIEDIEVPTRVRQRQKDFYNKRNRFLIPCRSIMPRRKIGGVAIFSFVVNYG